MSEAFLPFLLKDHFFIEKNENSDDFPEDIQQPPLILNLQFINFKQSSDFPTFLKILYDFHENPGCENLYVESEKVPSNIQSEIQTLVKMMHLIIPYGLSIELYYIFVLVFNHFKSLLNDPKYYATNELRLKLFSKFLKF